YTRLNGQFPNAAEAPENQTAIMTAYASLGRNNDVRTQARRLIDLYSPGGNWWRANEDNESVQKNAYEVVERELASLVVEQHRAAQQTKLVETYKLARDLYKEYLTKFTDTENTYKFGFFYSEILFELKQFQEAAEAYTAVVENQPKGQFTKNAAYTAILAWEKVMSGERETLGKKIKETKQGKAKGALKRLERIESLKKGNEYAAKDLTPVQRKLADACDRFVEVAQKDDEVVKVRFKSARLYFINNQFEEAAKRFEFIIDKYPRDPLARTAAESIIESFNVRKDWANLNKYARQVKGNKTLMADGKFASTINQFVEGASFNEILYVYEPKVEPKEAADRYAAFVEEFPKSTFSMVALYNAMVTYDKANLLEKSLDSAKTLLTEYDKFDPKKKGEVDGPKVPEPEVLRENATFQLANFYARLAQMEDAVKWYETYTKRFPKGEKRKDSIFNAALLREGLGEYEAAVKNYESYLREFRRADDRLDVAWHVGEIYEEAKDWKAAEKHFSTFGQVYGAPNKAKLVCAAYKTQKARIAQGAKERDLMRGWQSLYAQYNALPKNQISDDCALEAAGAAAFAMLQPEYDEFLAVKLVGSEKEVGKKLIAMLKKVDELQKKYTQVLAIGAGDFGIASLYRIGRIYQDLAQGIYDSQCPRRLTEDQCMLYQSALQEQAFPLEEKAIEAYNKALDKAYELGLYNEWLAKTTEALKVYEPGKFPQPRTFDLIASETAFEAPQLVEAQ
ncbi:MAG: tetratricopeptide repeat protein, partial [Myxococcota bacterium]